MTVLVLKKPLSTQRVLVGAISAIALAALAWVATNHDTGVVASGVNNISGESFWLQSGPGSVDGQGRAISAAFKTGLENMPKSLQGTSVPEGMTEDSQGNLVINQGIRDVFEYFLSGSVDEPLSTVHARILAYIQSHLGAKAAQQATSILDQYGAYKMALPDVANAYPGERADQVKARFAAIKNMRRATLGAQVADAFFAEEEAYALYTLNKGEVMQDGGLTLAQKNARIAELKKQLPPNTQESISTAEMLQNLEEVQTDWKARGGSPEELRAAREAIVGKEGAARLEAMDRETAAWDARMNTYLTQRAQILSDPSIAPDMKPKRIEALRAQSFKADEQLRVTALEGLHDETVAVAH